MPFGSTAGLESAGVAAARLVADGAVVSVVVVAGVSAGVVDVAVGAAVVDGAEVEDGSRSMFFASPTEAGSEICWACDGREGARPSLL